MCLEMDALSRRVQRVEEEILRRQRHLHLFHGQRANEQGLE